MILKYMLIFSVVLIVNSANEESEDYMDTLINMLMSGDAVEYDQDINDEAEPTLIGGLWQCGNCELIDDDSLIYREDNQVHNTFDDLPVEIQIGVAAPNMRCVTVNTDLDTSVVKRVTGACSGGSVTLSVSPPQNFVVNTYS